MGLEDYWVELGVNIGQVMNIFLCLTHNFGIKEKVKCNLFKGRTLKTITDKDYEFN